MFVEGENSQAPHVAFAKRVLVENAIFDEAIRKQRHGDDVFGAEIHEIAVKRQQFRVNDVDLPLWPRRAEAGRGEEAMRHADGGEGAVAAHVIAVRHRGFEKVLFRNHFLGGAGRQIARTGDVDEIVRRRLHIVIQAAENLIGDLAVAFMPHAEIDALGIGAVLEQFEIVVLRGRDVEFAVLETYVLELGEEQELAFLDLRGRQRIAVEFLAHALVNLTKVLFALGALHESLDAREGVSGNFEGHALRRGLHQLDGTKVPKGRVMSTRHEDSSVIGVFDFARAAGAVG